MYVRVTKHQNFSPLEEEQKQLVHVIFFFSLLKELLSLIENLRAKLVAERRRNVVQEMEIRKEMGDAMIQQILESEDLRR